MSLILDNSKGNPWVKLNFLNELTIGDYEIDLDDFCQMVKYVLSNTNLAEDDPRIDLVATIKTGEQMLGYGGNGKRIVFSALFWEKVRKAAESREREGTDEMVEEAKKLLGGDAPIVDADSTSVTLAGPPDTSGEK